MSMNLNEYQEKAEKYAAYQHAPEHHGINLYPFLALTEEAGEVAGKIAKAMRKGEPIDAGAVLMELGDVLWQVAACANELGYSLNEIAAMNLAKLGSRAVRGVIVGEGDDR